jgi:hypothetical protein
MPLKYDYDIRWVVANRIEDDPELGGFLKDVSLQQRNGGTYVALFRDPAAVQALRGADPVVQDFFKACGFGFNTYDSGAPDGYFPADDLAARNDVTERLAANLSVYDLTGKSTNGFDFDAFVASEIAAQPIEMDAVEAAANPVPGLSVSGLVKRAMGSVTRGAMLRLGVSLFMIFIFPHVASSVLAI